MNEIRNNPEKKTPEKRRFSVNHTTSLCRFKRRLSLCDLLPSKGTNNVGDFSAIVFFPLYSAIRIALTAGSGMKSLFTGIDFSNHKEVSFDDECLYLSCSFIFCYCLFVFFRINRLEPFFTDSVFSFRFLFRDPVSGFRIPSFSAACN